MKTSISILSFLFLASCSQKTYQIAYASYRDKNYDIFFVKGDTSSTLRLTNSPVTKYNLSWAPDGQRVYYTVYNKTNRQINAYDFQTNSEIIILNDTTVRSIADIARDNKTLLISATDDNSKGELYLYNLDTKIKTRITNNNWVESGAKFSPDGNSVVTSIQTSLSDSINRSGNAEIFLFNLIDNSSIQLTEIKGFNALPSFSPNGNNIAFHRCINNNCDIYVMNADGSSIKNLTQNTTDSRWPRWTPDGKWIAYTRSVDSNSDIYFISTNGKIIKPIINSTYKDEIAEIRPAVKKNDR